jgi:hypothetical protein
MGLDLFEALVVAYLASHIPITIFVDAQAIAPAGWHPAPARDLVAWYADAAGDVLMGASPPPWFRAIVTAEVFLQLPFFFLALAAIARRAGAVAGVPMREAWIFYGAHTATTLLPIFGTLWTAPEPAAKGTVGLLTAVYAPYFIMPLAMAWRAAARDELFTPPPQPAAAAGGKGAKGKKGTE